MNDLLVAMTAGEQNDTTVRAVLGLLGLGIVAMFVFSLVKACSEKRAGWIATASIFGFLSLLVLVGLLGRAVAVVDRQQAAARTERQAKAILAEVTEGKAKALVKMEIWSKEKDFSVKVPRTWVQKSQMGKESCLSAHDREDEAYLLILPQKKEDFAGTLRDYDDAWLQAMAEKMEGSQTMAQSSEPLGAYPALRHRLEGRLDHMNLVYYVTAVETKDSYCHLVTWTAKSRSEASAPVLKEVMDSFQAKAGPPEEEDE